MPAATPALQRARHRLAAARPLHRRTIAFLAGCASVAAFAPFFIWPVLFVTLPLLFWLAVDARDWRAAAIDGWSFGFGFYFVSLFWIGEAFLVEADKFAVLLPFAVTLLPAGMALFTALAAATTKLLADQLQRAALSHVLVFAIAVAATEWLRGHVLTGLPWNVLGYALTAEPHLMQAASVVGVDGLSALAALIFTAPLALLAQPGTVKTRLIAITATTLLPLIALAAFGTWRLAAADTRDVPGVKLRLVQPSVPQREKWMPEHQRRIFEDHLALSLTNPVGERDALAGITHVVWPEAAMPFLPLEHPEATAAIAAMLPPTATLITGALRRQRTAPDGAELPLPLGKLYNGILVFADDGSLAASYDKIHLVPFGEYLPLDPLLSALGLKKLTHGRGAFAAGASPRPLLAIPGLPPALGLVCYEALFAGEVRGADPAFNVIFNVTNDGWFGNTTGPRQHLQQARLRAVEQGVPLIRVANNGISAVFDSYGRERGRIDMNVRGTLDSALPASTSPTPYARHGDAFLLMILCIYAFAAMLLRHRSH